MTKYTFYDLSFWNEVGCDCGFGECLGEYVELYKSNLGLACSEEDCYVHAIKQHQGDISYGDSYLYCMTLEELKKLTKECGIEVEIV